VVVPVKKKVRPPKKASKRAASAPSTAEAIAELPPARRARWHLLQATIALNRAVADLSPKAPAAERRFLAAAADICDQAYAALHDEASADNRARLRTMAKGARRRLRSATGKADVERYIAESLPRDTATARRDFSFRALGETTASTNMAGAALFMLASGRHGDASKILGRWGITDTGLSLTSAAFRADVAELAAEIRTHMMTPPDGLLSEAIVRSMYSVLKLGEPFESQGAKRRRDRQSDPTPD
jgi:hypothetical protein